jgi:hypothetical protein
MASPAAGALNVARPVQFAWTADKATGVEVQVATDKAFAAVVKTTKLAADKGDITSLVLAELGPKTQYWWRVRGINEAGEGAWAAPATFTTTADAILPPTLPVALAPKPGAAGIDSTKAVRLEWSTDRAETCTVEVATSAGFGGATTLTATGKAIAAPALKEGATYYWRVKAKNAGGETVWSKAASFSTKKAETVVRIEDPPPPGPIRIVWEAENAKGIVPHTPEELLTWRGFKLEKWPQDLGGRVSGTAVKNVLSIRKVKPDEDDPKAPKPKVEGPAVTYTVNIPRKDTYYLWARTRWSTGCGNTVGIRLPGNPADLKIGGDGTYESLHWLCLTDGAAMDEPKPIVLEAGPNVFEAFPREPGIKVDEFLLTTDFKSRPGGAYNQTPGALAD